MKVLVRQGVGAVRLVDQAAATTVDMLLNVDKSAGGVVPPRPELIPDNHDWNPLVPRLHRYASLRRESTVASATFHQGNIG